MEPCSWKRLLLALSWSDIFLDRICWPEDCSDVMYLRGSPNTVRNTWIFCFSWSWWPQGHWPLNPNLVVATSLEGSLKVFKFHLEVLRLTFLSGMFLQGSDDFILPTHVIVGLKVQWIGCLVLSVEILQKLVVEMDRSLKKLTTLTRETLCSNFIQQRV